jgi:hypothetical protein
MADYRAISGVSTTVRQLLQNEMNIPIGFTVTVASPDVIIDDGSDDIRLNLFLYQISENSYLKNQDLPGHGHPGTFGRPPLSLDLYYLLTAYPSAETPDADLEPQQVLGEAMRVLHEFATITAPHLDDSLSSEFESIKITLLPAGTEDFSKIWTALPEGKFRLSAAYQVSVVQIENLQPRVYPQPVGEPDAAGPRVYAVPMQRPIIQELCVIRSDDTEGRERRLAVARIQDVLVIKGSKLAGEALRVVIDNLQIPLARTGQARIELEIPDDVLPDGETIDDDDQLQPGPHTLQIVQDIYMGQPPEPHMGISSNLAVFLLVPRIDSIDTSHPGSITITGLRLVHGNVECMTLVGDAVIAAEDYTVTSSTEISFALPSGLTPGEYLVRVRVNGAESVDNVRITI